MKKFITTLALFLVAILALSVAACQPNTEYAHKVTFNSNGGSAVEEIPFNAGDKVSAPETVPAKNGATFEGWYQDADFTKTFPFDTELEDKDYVAYARYKVTVRFEVGEGNTLADQTKRAGDMMILPTPVSATGEIFAGWYSDAARTKAIDGVYTVPNDSVTVYAKWTRVEKGSAINFLDGLTVNEKDHYTMNKTNDGVKIAPTAAKTAFSYLYSPINVPINGYSLLHVRYQGTKDQSMIVKLEGGNVPAIEQPLVFDGGVQELLWNVPTANIATEPGQRILIFVDGKENGNATNTEVTISALEFCRIVADGEEEKQVILFNSMGGNQVNPLLAVKDSDITLPTDVTKPGSTFDGWYTDANCTEKFTATKMPAGPTMLYAKWTENTEHTVTFVTNCDQNVDSKQVKEGDTIPVPELSVEGWQFLGWFESNEAQQPHSLVMPNKDITLYAHWLTLEDLSDKTTKQDLLGLTWTAHGDNFAATKEGNNLKLKLTTTDATDAYASASFTLTDDFTNALYIKVNGAAGDSLVFVYNGNVEKTVKLTGAEQQLWIYLDKQIVSGELRLKVVRGEGQLATQEVVISALELYSPTEKSIRVDTLKDWVSNQEGHYTVQYNEDDTVITATTQKTAWSFAKYDITKLPEKATKANAYKINVVVNGDEGHQIIIKINNKTEYKIQLDGADQELTIELDGFVATTENVLIIFIDGAVSKPQEEVSVTIKKCEILFKQDTGEYETVSTELLDKNWSTNMPNAYVFDRSADALKVTAQSPKGQWDVMRLSFTADNINVEGAFELKVVVTGPAGKKIMFKYNNSNATEQKRDLDGTRQEFTVSLEGLDLSKNEFLQIFFDPGTSYKDTDSTMEVTFHSIQLVCKVAK